MVWKKRIQLVHNYILEIYSNEKIVLEDSLPRILCASFYNL